ncbi:MAG: adenylosuccinate synthase [Oligoflexales bacterium]
MSQVHILVGAQWGDEGKGKWVDILSAHKDIVARFQGGNNAGHTLYINEEKIVLHQLPSGIFQKRKVLALLSGVVINPVQLALEIDSVADKVTLNADNLWISEKAHVITPYHIYLDQKNESQSATPIGTTKRGIGPTYSDKIERTGIRMISYIDDAHRKEWLAHLLDSSCEFRQSYEENKQPWEEFEQAAEKLKPFVQAAEQRVRNELKNSKSLMLEGAQGTLLDISHGTYPFVTSSSTISGGAISSLGMDPRKVTKIYGIAKAYVTRVGEGPFPTELKDDVGKKLGDKGHEFGATTNRPRRCGWFDAVAMRYAAEVNGFDVVLLNKMDILSGFEELKIATAYKHPNLGILKEFPSDERILAACEPIYESVPGFIEEIPETGSFNDLPENARAYCKRIEELCDIKIGMVGTGPKRNDYITCV